MAQGVCGDVCVCVSVRVLHVDRANGGGEHSTASRYSLPSCEQLRGEQDVDQNDHHEERIREVGYFLRGKDREQ